MENQILEAINHIKNISKKKITIDRIVAQLDNSAAANWDLESIKSCLNEMTAKGIIDERYKLLTNFGIEDTSLQNNEQINFAETKPPPSRHILTPRKSEGSKSYEEIENIKTEFAALKKFLDARNLRSENKLRIQFRIKFKKRKYTSQR